MINELGQYEVLNQDLSGLDVAEEIKEVPTELMSSYKKSTTLHQQEGIAAVAQPWLATTQKSGSLDELDKGRTDRGLAKQDSSSVLIRGRRYPASAKEKLSPSICQKMGISSFTGSPGTGKTTFLQTAAMDLARKQCPENLTMYLLDFGTNGLAPLTQLPHVR